MRAALLLIGVSFGAQSAPLLRSEGVAQTPDGQLAYREVHWQQGTAEGAQRWVQYLCPDGRPFARKQLPATDLAQARGYALQDQRSGQVAEVDVAKGKVQVAWKESADVAFRSQRLPLSAEAVIDAGFDAAVRTHWAALMSGKPVELPFLVPGRQRFYPVRIQRRGAVRWQGQAAQTIEVKLDTWYGAVAPRLSLVYADADRRLLEFRGISNLRDAQGQYPSVVIRFASAPLERPVEQWQRELKQPLVDRCGQETL